MSQNRVDCVTYGSRAIFGDDRRERMSNTPVPADDTTWDYQLGYNEGEKFERDRIVRLLELEVSEWLSHDGECDCKVKGEEGVRLIGLIRGPSF